MKIPKRIQPLVDDGLVDEVIRRLKSGKEADVHVVRCGSDIRCAKVYKEAENRSFKQAVQYQEGRKVRNSVMPGQWLKALNLAANSKRKPGKLRGGCVVPVS